MNKVASFKIGKEILRSLFEHNNTHFQRHCFAINRRKSTTIQSSENGNGDNKGSKSGGKEKEKQEPNVYVRRLFASPVPSIKTTIASTSERETVMIPEEVAKSDYDLTEEELNELPSEERNGTRYYHIDNLIAQSDAVHAVIFTKKQRIFNENDRERLILEFKKSVHIPGTVSREPKAGKSRWTVNFAGGGGKGADHGANNVVFVAWGMNCLDLIIKGFAAYITSSHSLRAEAIHSLMDLINQTLLGWGNWKAAKKANPDHPYGYGNYKYIFSLFAGFGILAGGSVGNILVGYYGLYYPPELDSLSSGISLLFVSLFLQSVSFGNAFIKVRNRAKVEKLPIRKYLMSPGADPSVKVVFFEDSASIIGVLIALGCVSLTHYCENPMFDSVGSMLIGVVLGVSASSIICSNAQHLAGKSIPEPKRTEIINFMKQDPIVKRVHDVKIINMGVGNWRLKAEIDYDGREITRRYLDENGNREKMQSQYDQIETNEQLDEFALHLGDALIDKNANEVDRVEKELRDKFPELKHIDLETSG